MITSYYVESDGVEKSIFEFDNGEVKLIDNCTKETILNPFFDYTKYSVEGEFNFTSTADQITAHKHNKNLRLEISDAPDAAGTKVLKLYIANGTGNAVPMAMGVIPAESCLIADDTDASDNKIIFKHNSLVDNGADLGEISVAIPDSSITEEGFKLEKVNDLTAITDGASVKVVASYPIARTAKSQITNGMKPVTVMLALYDADGKLCADSPISLKAIKVYKGAKAEFDFANKSLTAAKAKLFVWGGLNTLRPYDDMVKAVTVE